MKMTEYGAELVTKGGKDFTMVTIGSKVINSRIERLTIALGGKLLKQTKRLKSYELEGDKLLYLAL
jgi:hypothetical protein